MLDAPFDRAYLFTEEPPPGMQMKFRDEASRRLQEVREALYGPLE
jgi:hypothetical protein